ncbi:hypothetical protein EIP86_010425 [Pleurotus ostreatoroseus]|nr:hypothetical protein EIP86_010425 [Pleurotus ostreatoroseus]
MVSQYPTPEWIKEPPIPSGPYTQEKALDDIPGVLYALHLFLASHMLESEAHCNKIDPTKERLYVATGFGLIQCVKGLMSFEDQHGNTIAQQHRKRSAALPTRLAGLVIGSLNTSGVGFIKSMTPVERHAELVYAESLFEKAIVGIAYSGDWLAFIKEAVLGKFLEESDAAAQAQGKPEDTSIDVHFRSGVYLGVGLSHLILSMMPSRLLSLIELFGYKGDRHTGLRLLYKAGGWSKGSDEPGVPSEREGIRRTICDMALIIFHLVFSAFTSEGVDMGMAEKIINFHIRRYPNGVFFLFGQGRLKLCRSQPAQALEYYQRAMEVQDQYRNLHHISYWEMAVANLALWNVPASLECWRKLQAEATWSKATYTYGTAVCLLEVGGEKEREEAGKLLQQVEGLRQRIAGKSIPLEKFVARKARKFESQGHRLALPILEFAYFFLVIVHAPRDVLKEKMLPQVEQVLAKLKAHKDQPAQYEGGQGYWDDRCLAHFLEGICLRYIAYPDPDAVVDLSKEPAAVRADAETRAAAAFQAVIADAANIQHDHYLLYYSRAHPSPPIYLLSPLTARFLFLGLDLPAGSTAQTTSSASCWRARATRRPRGGTSSSSCQGKYSMENALHIRTHAALEALNGDQSRCLFT